MSKATITVKISTLITFAEVMLTIGYESAKGGSDLKDILKLNTDKAKQILLERSIAYQEEESNQEERQA